jgi:hypothetical protein
MLCTHLPMKEVLSAEARGIIFPFRKHWFRGSDKC